MKREQLLPVAIEVLGALRTLCDQGEIAGSLRRGSPLCNDIEIVARPPWEQNLLGEDSARCEALEALLRSQALASLLALDLDCKRNGPRYKRFRVLPLDCALDLFLCTPENYGNLLALRTGDSDFSHWLVAARPWGAMPPGLFHQKGKLWDAHSPQAAQEARDCHMTYWHAVSSGWRPNPSIIPCPTEAAFFAALGLPLTPPAERHRGAILRMRKQIQEGRQPCLR